MQNPIAESKRGSDEAALAAARDGWSTTARYVLILVLSRGVPWAIVLALANLAREML